MGDMAQMQKMIEEAMNDPALMESMAGFNQDVGAAMQQLAEMDPAKLRQQMQEGLSLLTTPEMMETVLGQKENDLEFFEKEMAKAFDQMKEIFANPEALDAATEMMKGFSHLLANPEKAMKDLATMFAGELSNDDQIEEARLQLLSNPEKAGHPALAQMFENEEMQEILKDPVKWREQVKKGQSMLLGEEEGAGIGEL